MPASRHEARSPSRIWREALTIDGSVGPMARQKVLKPPPVPLVSTIGAGWSEIAPNCSAAVVEKGATVDDPTMRIFSASPIEKTGGASLCSRNLRQIDGRAAAGES